MINGYGDAITAYLAFGTLWVGLGILTGYLRISNSMLPPIVPLITVILCWPYILWRMIQNVMAGDPNGSVWPPK